MFTEEKLPLMPLVKIFATGPHAPRNLTLLLLHALSITTFQLKRYSQQLDCSLKIDQPFREDPCTGENRRRNTRVLFGPKLEVGHQLYMKLDLPDRCYQRHFCYNAVENTLVMFTSIFCGKMIQIELPIKFLQEGGHFWATEEIWTEVGELMGRSASKFVTGVHRIFQQV